MRFCRSRSLQQRGDSDDKRWSDSKDRKEKGLVLQINYELTSSQVAVKTAIVPFDKSIEPWRIRLVSDMNSDVHCFLT